MTAVLTIRPRRQITIPQPLLAMVGASVGDRFIAEPARESIILKPQKQLAINALKAMQKAFRESGIPEKEMQDNLKRIRRESYRQPYAQSLPR